jgi:hypothetical protein
MDELDDVYCVYQNESNPNQKCVSFVLLSVFSSKICSDPLDDVYDSYTQEVADEAELGHRSGIVEQQAIKQWTEVVWKHATQCNSPNSRYE